MVLYIQIQYFEGSKDHGGNPPNLSLTNQLTCFLLANFPRIFGPTEKAPHTGRESWLRCWTSQHLALEFGNFFANKKWVKKWCRHTIDGSEIRHPPVEVGSLSRYLHCFIRPRWCRISEPSTVSPCPLMVSWGLGWCFGFRLDPPKWKGLGFWGVSLQSQTANLPLVDMVSDVGRFFGRVFKSRNINQVSKHMIVS